MGSNNNRTTTSETGSKLVRAVCTGTALQVHIDVKRIPLIFCEISVGENSPFYTIRNYVVIFKCQHHSYGCQRRKNLGCGHAEIEANNTNNNKKVVKKEGRKQK